MKDASVGDQGFEVDIHSPGVNDESVWFVKGDKIANIEVSSGVAGSAFEAGAGGRRQDLASYNRLPRSPRRVMPSFAYTCAKCVCTVRVEICRCSAISTSLLPPAASAAI